MRAFYSYAWALLLCIFLASPSFAGEGEAKSSARDALKLSVTRIMDYIKNPGYKDTQTRQSLNKEIEREVYIIFDFAEFSMRTVGQRWKNFTPEQQKAFEQAFADLLFSTYLDRVDGYNGENVIYAGEISNKSGSRVEVRTMVAMQNNQKIPVSYRMLLKAGKWRVYDVLIEGISLVKNYRTQFGDILSKASPEELTARIRERATALRSKMHEKDL